MQKKIVTISRPVSYTHLVVCRCRPAGDVELKSAFVY